jgi:4-hydroxybenzoate polyprenyltransferase
MDKDSRNTVLSWFFFIIFFPIMFGYIILTGFDDLEPDKESLYLKEME